MIVLLHLLQKNTDIILLHDNSLGSMAAAGRNDTRNDNIHIILVIYVMIIAHIILVRYIILVLVLYVYHT